MSRSDHAVDVTIRNYRLAVDILGGRELSWQLAEDATVEDLLAGLGEQYDLDPDELLVMVNGRNIKQLDGTRTPLSDGDEVALSIGSVNE